MEKNYGVQAINLALKKKLKSRFKNSSFTLLMDKTPTKGDIRFAKKHDFKLVEFPGYFKIPEHADFFDRHIIYKKLYNKNANKNKIDLFTKELKACDVLIDTEGIGYTGKWHEYAKTSYFHLLSKEYDILYLKFTKSFGPFNGKYPNPRWIIYKHLIKKKLNELPFLLVRGDFNLKQIKSLNLNIPIHSFPDASMSLEPEPKEWGKKFLLDKGINLSQPLIGISPTYVIQSLPAQQNNTCGENHIVLCKDMINTFKNKGCNVLIIPHSILDGKDETQCDLALCKRFYNDFKRDKNVFLLEDIDLTYTQVRSIIGLLDFYMTGRYHSVCSALYMGIPIVCFSWHIKYKDVMSLFLEDYLVLNCRQKGVEECKKLILKYYNDRSWFDKEKVLKRRKAVNKEIDISIDLIADEINRHFSK